MIGQLHFAPDGAWLERCRRSAINISLLAELIHSLSQIDVDLLPLGYRGIAEACELYVRSLRNDRGSIASGRHALYKNSSSKK